MSIWEGLPYSPVDGPTARLVRVDFDRDEEPATLHLLVTLDVLQAVTDRVAGVTGARIPGRADLAGLVLPMGAAADLARLFGTIGGPAEEAFYRCIAHQVANVWWENGLGEAPTARLTLTPTPGRP